VGNLTAGGAGKTPIVRDFAARLRAQGRNPAILSRGYGGRQRGPLRVDPGRHIAADVGDEPLLLARDSPCWIARDRAKGARAIAAAGAGIIIMDDGLQNPQLHQDLRLIAVDGAAGFGNGRAIPAGPLRERAADGLDRADALIVMGEDDTGVAASAAGRLPVIRARLALAGGPSLAGSRLFAFAGIGRPEKFRATLLEGGAELLAFRAFPDHHAYLKSELIALSAKARDLNAKLATTEKDWVRLSPEWRERVTPIPVAVRWDDESAISALLNGLPHHG